MLTIGKYGERFPIFYYVFKLGAVQLFISVKFVVSSAYYFNFFRIKIYIHT